MKNILNRKNLFTTQSITLLIIIAVILVLINLISINHFGRLDLTLDKQYTISTATKNTIKNLDDLVTIKAYFSEKLPPDLTQSSQYVKDILSEYKAYSSKVKIVIIDPGQNETIKTEAKSLGIPEVEMQIMEKDEFKVQKGFFGLAIFYADKKEIIPLVQDPQNLEYEITSIIKRLTTEQLKTVGFLSGHAEHRLYDSAGFSAPETENAVNDYTEIKKDLDKNYNVTGVELTVDDALANIDTLIIAGPKNSLTDWELYQIDQYIMNGGNVIFLADEVNVAEGLQTTLLQTGLEKILNGYGITPNQDLVVDTSNENVGFTSGYMQFFMPYPYWPKLIKANFDQKNPIMSRLQSISLSWASSLTINNLNGIDYTNLASTTKNAGIVTSPFNLDPQQQINPTKKQQSPMIVLAQGNFQSAFADQDAPKPDNSEQKNTNDKINQAKNSAKIMVMADSDFINDANLKRFPDNGVFFQNAVDYLTMGSDLISIRAKNLTDRPIKQLDDEGKMIVKTVNLILIPGLVIIFGLYRFYKRKKK